MQSYYQESSELQAWSAQETARVRAEHGIEVHGEEVPKPVTSFHHLSLPAPIANQMNALGYHVCD